MTDRPALLNAAQQYLARWQAYLAANPNADETAVTAAMQRGDPPPSPIETSTDETAVNAWESTHPAAYRIYWTIRAAMEEQDGKKIATHHRAAILAIHESFPSKPDRDRLGLPPTILQLADMLGVTDRALRNAREKYQAIFDTTQATVSAAFIGTYYSRVYEAIGKTAVMVGREGHADRQLFVKLAGDLVDKTDITSGGERLGQTIEEWRVQQGIARKEAEEQTTDTLDIFEDK